MNELQRVKGNEQQFFLVLQGVSAGFGSDFSEQEITLIQMVTEYSEGNTGRYGAAQHTAPP